MKAKVLLTPILIVATLLLSNPIYSQDKERDWTAFSQKIDVSTTKKIKFKLTASVKADVANTDGKAGLWARVDHKKKGMGFFDNMMDRPITTNKWKEYTIEGELDKKSAQLYFGGLIIGNGNFMFDDFKVYIENPKTGEYDYIPVENGSFEKPVKEGKIQGWPIGVTITQNEKIKGYSFNLSDDAADQSKALLVTGDGVKKNQANYIGPLDGYSPQVGTLVTMLNNLKQRIEYTVGNLSQEELDYVLDEKANSIGALIAHLTATEKLYQIITFEQREPNDQEMEILNDAMELGDLGRKNLRGKDVRKYLEEFTEARKKTMELLKEKDDEWLATIPEGSSVSNFFSWFHVMEHQSSHLGQILLLKKRIPENLDMNIKAPKKID